MKRRSFLASAALAAPALALAPRHLQAASHAAAPMLPAAQAFRIGDMTVTALSDGALRLGPETLQGIDADGYAALMEANFRNPETFRAAVNAFLITGDAGTILVDAGTGGAMGPDLGRLMGNLESAGVAADDVTLLIATHLHPDHIGGAIDGASAVFANAEFAVAEAEVAFWTDDAMKSAAGAGAAMFFDMARATLDAYADRTRQFSGKAEIAPGIVAMPLPGHTPGHTGLMLSSGDESLLIWADILHVPPVQLARPEVTIAFDTDPAQAAETRARILDRVAADRTLVAGSHMSFPGLAHVVRDTEGYRAVAAPFDYIEYDA